MRRRLAAIVDGGRAVAVQAAGAGAGDGFVSGVVKWWNSEKGYGFLTPDGGSDVFAHFSEIKMAGFRDPQDNQPVRFKIVDGAKGPQAREITPL